MRGQFDTANRTTIRDRRDGLPLDQRQRYERDLAAESKRAAQERAQASTHRRDGDAELAEAAEARALDAEQHAQSLRAVLDRFAPRARSEAAAHHQNPRKANP